MTAAGLTAQLRALVAAPLGRLGLLSTARKLRLRGALLIDAENRRLNHADRERFTHFSREHGAVISPDRGMPRPSSSRTALVVSSRCPSIEAELCVIKALHVSGFRVVVLLEDERRALAPFYQLVGVERVRFWSEWMASDHSTGAARTIVNGCRSTDDLMSVTRNGVRIGLIAVCTVLRRLHVGALDWQSRDTREQLVRAVAASLGSIAESERLLDEVRPALVLTEPEYTPKGELFESCLRRGLAVVAYDSAHRSTALMFKRYGQHNRDEHWTTMSAESWRALQRFEWTERAELTLSEEIRTTYESGDWYGTTGTSRPRPAGATIDVHAALRLHPDRKTAFVFPHMLWDAPVMWGRPVFPSYQQWFVETIAAACENPRLNWVIKLHPAHVRKQVDEGYGGDSAEMAVLHQRFGRLPSHITVIPPDSPLSTFSLFPVMDYCLTVRGTVGVEAARHGIPVLTAGPARYSERGFTVDSSSRDEYLERLTHIDRVPRLSAAQQGLAQRFAYGLFVARPCPLTSVTWDIATPDALQRPRAGMTVRSPREWETAPDVSAMARWLASTDDDFLDLRA